MGELIKNATSVNGDNYEFLGLDEYVSDEALAAVDLFEGYHDGILRFASVCCMVFMLIGIPGNLITIIALARCKKVHNATALFIINLSLSDLLFCCLELPMAATTFWAKSWVFGITMCRVFPMAKYGLVAVSLFSITAITINRYIIISHPMLYTKIYTKRNLILMVMAIWLFCISAMIPMWTEAWGRFSLDPKIGSCTIIKDIHDRSPKKYLFVIAFVIPGLTITFCYARIFFIVKRVTKRSHSSYNVNRCVTESIAIDINSARTSTLANIKISNPKMYIRHLQCLSTPSSENSSCSGVETPENDIESDLNRKRTSTIDKIRKAFINRRPTLSPKPNLPTRKDKKLRTMIVAIMLAFFLCHLPISLIKIFFEFTNHTSLKIVSYVLIFLTTCVNPIIYVVMSNEYRQAYKDLITCQPQTDAESAGTRIVNTLNKSFRRSSRKVKLKNTQDVNC
ncbi:G-protein coupled receptor moody-like [Plodia interpunctella]|uniref:G-protein coupled receptor moody-like n=1 Tax=Plodia interpunctella TaxID=58824 RepID=UPI0023689E31|nr:G-protein coupled receptor moody-like [Plodia interpunctella]